MQISIIAASNNNNLILAKAFQNEFESLKTSPHIINLVEENLPLYDPNKSKEDLPQSFSTLVKKLKGAEAFVFLAPEYNGGLPPTLTNLLAWVSVSTKDWRECFNENPAIIGSHSGGGGSHVLMAMRLQLSFIGLNVLGRQIMVNSSRPLNPDSLKALTRQIVKL